MLEHDTNELIDNTGARIPWRTFYAVMVAANRDDITQNISEVQLLVGYQTKPGTARIQTTADGMHKMLTEGNRIPTATYNSEIGKWTTGSLVKLTPDGSLCVGSTNLPEFDWVDSPKREQKRGG